MRVGFVDLTIGERFVAFPQTTKERLLLERRVAHDNPCLGMGLSHTTIRMDAAGNRAPD